MSTLPVSRCATDPIALEAPLPNQKVAPQAHVTITERALPPLSISGNVFKKLNFSSRPSSTKPSPASSTTTSPNSTITPTNSGAHTPRQVAVRILTQSSSPLELLNLDDMDEDLPKSQGPR